MATVNLLQIVTALNDAVMVVDQVKMLLNSYTQGKVITLEDLAQATSTRKEALAALQEAIAEKQNVAPEGN